MTKISPTLLALHFSDISLDNIYNSQFNKLPNDVNEYIVYYNVGNQKIKKTIKTQLKKKVAKRKVNKVEERKTWKKFGKDKDNDKFKPRICDETKIEITCKNKKKKVSNDISSNVTIYNKNEMKIPEKEKKEVGVYRAPRRGNRNSKVNVKFDTFKKLYDKKKNTDEYYNNLIDKKLKKMKSIEFLEEYNLLHNIDENEYKLYMDYKYDRKKAIQHMKDINEEIRNQILEETKLELGYKEEEKKKVSTAYIPPCKKKNYTSDRNRNQIKISNFVKGTTKEELFDLCSRFGRTTSVFIPISKRGRNKGQPLDIAFVTLQSSKDVESCIKQLHKSKFNSMIINVEINVRK